MSNTVIKGWAVAVAATSMLLVGCGSDDPTPVTESATASPDDVATSSVTSEVPATSEAPAASSLEGAWQAGPISPEESEATLRRHGLDQWITDYRANTPLPENTLLSLTIEDGEWDLYGESNGGQPEPIDYDAEYEIEGNKVVFVHSDGANTYRWKINNETLRLEFVGSTLPAYEGIPEEVFQRALYMTAPFTKQD